MAIGLYWLLVLADIFLLVIGADSYRNFTKPLLMPALMLLYILSVRLSSNFSKLLLTGLFFSWLGDIFLLRNDWFIAGLVCFLLTHLAYIVYFLSASNKTKGLLQFQPLIAIPVLIYLFLFLWLLQPYLDELRWPVFIYAAVICFMLICSINLFRKLERNSATLFFNGAFQFLISDSLLAVHKFVYPLQALPLTVMLTYCSAQFLIVQGSIHHLKAMEK